MTIPGPRVPPLRARSSTPSAAFLLLASFLAIVPRPARAEERALPSLAHAHAHNDYRHERPLLDALDHGFTSFEADVFLVGGVFLVAHDARATRPERTLRRLYLDPLRQRVKEHGGSVHGDGRECVLLVDLKSAGEPAYRALREVLAEYRDLLTEFRGGKPRRRAVTVLLSGNRPIEAVRRQEVRYCALDGRPADLEAGEPAHLFPLVSDRWGNWFRWSGRGPMPAPEREKLAAFVRRAHAAGMKVRFWGTPDRPALWRELRVADVDLVNADDLPLLEAFLAGEIAAEERRGAGP